MKKYDDYISRQSAIDAIKEFQHGAAEWRDEQEERSDIWHRADSAIASALEIGLRVKKLPSAQQWIPCSESLPEKDGYYLTTTCYRQVYADYWNEDHFDRTEAVTAWMPLPEPYKGEES